MSNTLQVKKGILAPTNLLYGELFLEDQILHVGDSSNNTIEIANKNQLYSHNIFNYTRTNTFITANKSATYNYIISSGSIPNIIISNPQNINKTYWIKILNISESIQSMSITFGISGSNLKTVYISPNQNIDLFSISNYWQISYIPSIQAPNIIEIKLGSGTYLTPLNINYLKIKMISAGSGGNGGGSGTRGPGLSGTDTIFGLLTLTGAQAGNSITIAPILPSGYQGFTRNGYIGSYGNFTGLSDVGAVGGNGANSIFGPGAIGGNQAFAALNPIENYGSGGGGGGCFGLTGFTSLSGSGGNSGCYAEFIIKSPSSSYNYSIGIGGNPGVGGNNGNSASKGSDGIIIIEEY